MEEKRLCADKESDMNMGLAEVSDTTTKIFEILTKKRYNRDEPYLEDEIKERISFFIAKKKPIKLIGFWGVGPKSKSNWADVTCCEFLQKHNEEIEQIYPKGIEFTFIFSTPHGIHNGIEKDRINSYTKDIEKLFKKVGFKYIYLDKLWQKYNICFEKIDDILKQKPKGWWSKIENAKLLEENAKNRNEKLIPKIAAQKYYIMRNLEKEMLEKEFKDSIFSTFSGPRLRKVLPDMPTLYFYSWKKRKSNAPWFIIE